MEPSLLALENAPPFPSRKCKTHIHWSALSD